MKNKKKTIGLIPKLIIAIILGILIGLYMPEFVARAVVTLSGFFSTFLKFVVPLMILAYVTMGIADLSQGAGKLLAITVAIAYCSTLIAGSASYMVASTLFPSFMSAGALEQIAATSGVSVAPYFSISIPPLLDTLSAVVLAFVLGLCMSAMRGKEMGNTLYNAISDFSKIIDKTLHTVIIPLLPLYICGTFVDMTRSGKTFAILGILWKVFLVVIAMHLVCIAIQFVIAGAVSGKNPLTLLKNQFPAYTTALGTQSSAATIPVTLQATKKNGVSDMIAEFVIPLCATIHLSGSTITLTSCSIAIMMLNGWEITFMQMFPFILMLGVTMVAAPGVPGGAVMAALGILESMLGFNEPMLALMIALYIAQDSFGTACNVTGDGAIAVFMDAITGKKNK